ncbi:site-specific integrase [uncultured Roseovarius sp.]|uniref:site-specific integrase n=1 Tax=uncultured Roseovarius sp. TaxID=293344 RepID=UPI0026135480|nr:site-specific integrase [uncultured Roseovarius sp.]
MGLAMPNPSKVGNVYYLRVSVPSDVKDRVKGTLLVVQVAGKDYAVKIGDHAKASLRTKDAKEAKSRFVAALAAVEAHWEAIRHGPPPLTHKATLAIAGQIRASYIAARDDDPGDAEELTKELIEVFRATAGRLDLSKEPTDEQVAADLERLVGPMTDKFLNQLGILVPPESRSKLLAEVAGALTEAIYVTKAKAEGDYSVTGETAKYPPLEAPRKPVNETPSAELTLQGVIDNQVRNRAAGRDAKPLPATTVNKYRLAAKEFEEFRGTGVIATITPREADAWKLKMLEEAKLGNRTVRNRVENVRTVVGWAMAQSFGELFANGNPFYLIELPSYTETPSDMRAFTSEEARQVLRAARKETNVDLRWLPWLCAYSGARINEVAQLTKADFFEVDGEPFYRLTTMGGKTLKTQSSERRVPVHPDLIAEGLLDFVKASEDAPKERLFPPRSQGNVRDWVRNDLKITRPELQPNHGWRHLFEDKCMADGVTDSAKDFITGRSTGKSGAMYGKSEASLPGLAREMRKITSFLK